MASLSLVERHRNYSPDLKEFYADLLKSTDGIEQEIDSVTLHNAGTRILESDVDQKFVTVEFTNKKLAPVHLLAKIISKNNDDAVISKEFKTFEKEVTFYKEYLPAAKKLCREKGVSETLLTDIYPKFYYGDENVIIIENVDEGTDYKTLGDKKLHDVHTAKLVLKTLAEHHAISYSLIMEKGGPENFFKQFPYLDFNFLSTTCVKNIEPLLSSAVSANMTIVETNSERIKGSSEAISELNALMPISCTFIEWIRKSLRIEDGEFLVLNHGDYRYPVMRFLKTDGKAVKQKIIDFSKSFYNSPSVDVAYYLLTCVDTYFRQKHFHELLQHYLTIFTELCTNFGYPADLTYEKLYTQYRKKMYYPLMTSFMIRYGPVKDMKKDQTISQKIFNEDWARAVLIDGVKWVQSKSGRAVHTATEIVSVMKEYKNLSLLSSEVNIE